MGTARCDSAVCMPATGAPICSLLISGWGNSGTVLGFAKVDLFEELEFEYNPRVERE